MNPSPCCVVLCVLSLTGSAAAHGGAYRGPGCVVPGPSSTDAGRSQGGSGSSSGGTTGPSTSGGSSAPTPAAPSAPVSTGMRGATARGIDLGDDPSRWQIWWSYHRDPYLNLRSAIHLNSEVPGSDEFFLGRIVRSGARDTLRPSAKEVLEQVYPKLRQALEKTRQRDIVSSCLVALARIGARPDEVLPLLRGFLPDRDQEIAETAALCYGILGDANGIPDLLAIAGDDARGRELTARPAGIGFRTRAFAAYGLGLIAHGDSAPAVKESVLEALAPLLDRGTSVPTDVQVAAIHGLRLLRVTLDDSAGAPLAHKALQVLMRFYGDQQPGLELAQAHVPAAMAELVRRSASAGAPWRARLLADLQDPQRSTWIRQSCAQALGEMVASGDEATLKVMRKAHGSLHEQQTRRFLAVSLGQIGGEPNRQFLIQEFNAGRKQDKAWIALALGIHSARGRAQRPGAEPDRALGELLLRELNQARNPEMLAALCLALGLTGCEDASTRILEVAREQAHDDDVCGTASVALGLLGHKAATTAIQSLVEQSVSRPDRLRQTAVALGLLGDKTAATTLTRLLTERTSLAAQSALASAVGAIGDQRSIEPLGQLLGDETQQPLTRAFAAVALGLIADRQDFAWNTPIARGLNYRLATETLSNGANGILDIL